MVIFADPVVSASLYCDQLLDEAVFRVMVPLRQRLRAHDPEAYLWFMRYARRGEHLKIRIHGAPDLAPQGRELIREIAGLFLSGLGPAEAGKERLTRPESIPIDEEDKSAEDHPDRTLIFTRYGRSFVVLGGEPFLLQDEYRAHMTACLAGGCDRLLDTLEREGQLLSPGRRRLHLIETVVSGLATLGFSRAKATEYVAHHRDWLVRFPILKTGGTEEKTATMLRRFDAQAQSLAPVIEALRASVAEIWSGPGQIPPRRVDAPDRSWELAISRLAEHVGRFRDDPDYLLDPFAADPVFPPLFKAFHGLGNQIGLKMLEEGLTYHLLLSAIAEEPAAHARIRLMPD